MTTKLLLAVLICALAAACGGKSPAEEQMAAALAAEAQQREAREAFTPDPIMSLDLPVSRYYDDADLMAKTDKACKEYTEATRDAFYFNKFPACQRSDNAKEYKKRGRRPD